MIEEISKKKKLDWKAQLLSIIQNQTANTGNPPVESSSGSVDKQATQGGAEFKLGGGADKAKEQAIAGIDAFAEQQSERAKALEQGQAQNKPIVERGGPQNLISLLRSKRQSKQSPGETAIDSAYKSKRNFY